VEAHATIKQSWDHSHANGLLWRWFRDDYFDAPKPDVRVYCDARFGPGDVASWGFVVIWGCRRVEAFGSACGRVEDNNAAEFWAFTEALKYLWRSGLRRRRIEICTDSMAVKLDNCGTREDRIVAAWLLGEMEWVRVILVPRSDPAREWIKRAHNLAREAFVKAREGGFVGPEIHFYWEG